MHIRTKLAAVGIMTFCVALSAQAGKIAQKRGYANCVEQIEQKLDRQQPKVSSGSYLAETGEHMAFYLNATAWQDGNRQPMRSKCLTSTSGHNALAVNVEPGRFDGMPLGKAEIKAADSGP